ncbi:hypothetical protein Poly21_15790 [Allorhodopirellula heiligendammensis]|uniref:Uncharacterized protein n=1 Tax=Allorhodopirellula heiligendammensis TaxID=2714739 RepID=A0A5C6C7J9_9BACT|nr:hypothetical protein Poly21_15790 [Allorhodopirellula heiligendammensis]
MTLRIPTSESRALAAAPSIPWYLEKSNALVPVAVVGRTFTMRHGTLEQISRTGCVVSTQRYFSNAGRANCDQSHHQRPGDRVRAAMMLPKAT